MLTLKTQDSFTNSHFWKRKFANNERIPQNCPKLRIQIVDVLYACVFIGFWLMCLEESKRYGFVHVCVCETYSIWLVYSNIINEYYQHITKLQTFPPLSLNGAPQEWILHTPLGRAPVLLGYFGTELVLWWNHMDAFPPRLQSWPFSTTRLIPVQGLVGC